MDSVSTMSAKQEHGNGTFVPAKGDSISLRLDSLDGNGLPSEERSVNIVKVKHGSNKGMLSMFEDAQYSLPERDLTREEAAAIRTVHGHGMMLDGINDYLPGINCITCGRFVGRDGYIHIAHYEMSSQVASVDGECRACIDHEHDKRNEGLPQNGSYFDIATGGYVYV